MFITNEYDILILVECALRCNTRYLGVCKLNDFSANRCIQQLIRKVRKDFDREQRYENKRDSLKNKHMLHKLHEETRSNRCIYKWSQNVLIFNDLRVSAVVDINLWKERYFSHHISLVFIETFIK